MNNIKKVLSAWMLVACVLPVAAQYPVIPDSVKARGAKQEAEFERKSDAAAVPAVVGFISRELSFIYRHQ